MWQSPLTHLIHIRYSMIILSYINRVKCSDRLLLSFLWGFISRWDLHVGSICFRFIIFMFGRAETVFNDVGRYVPRQCVVTVLSHKRSKSLPYTGFNSLVSCSTSWRSSCEECFRGVFVLLLCWEENLFLVHGTLAKWCLNCFILNISECITDIMLGQFLGDGLRVLPCSDGRVNLMYQLFPVLTGSPSLGFTDWVHLCYFLDLLIGSCIILSKQTLWIVLKLNWTKIYLMGLLTLFNGG